MEGDLVSINNIRWKLNEVFDNHIINAPVGVIEWNRINRLPLADGNIYFNDDFWDFSKVDTIFREKSKLRYDFSNILYSYKDYVKGLILKLIIIDRDSFSTIKGRMGKLLKFNEYLKKNYLYDFDLITLNRIKEFMNSLNSGNREEIKKQYNFSIMQLLIYINTYNPKLNYSSIYKYLERYSNPQKLKAEREAGKTPDIPRGYFNQLISCALKDINDPSLKDGCKVEACIILLLSQIGMRLGELRLIEAGRKKEIRIFDDTESVFYLEFKTYKTVKSDSYKWTKSFLTDKATLAYDTLEKITEDDRVKYNIKFLLFNPGEKIRPYNQQTIRNKIMKFVARHKDEIDCINKSEEELPGFMRKIINRQIKLRGGGPLYIKLKYIEDLKEGDIISAPNPHQFRVALCTRMVEDKKNIDLDWIREHMNHLTEEMTIHYIRKKEQSEKDRLFARGILKSIVTEEFRLLGHDASILTEKIKEFMDNKKFNVKKDLDVIINELAGKIPIKEKAEGFCIKGAFGRKCALDSTGDEIYCAFDLCPNQCFCYKNVDITYERYFSKKNIIEYNFKNGFRKEAEKETNKMKRLIDERLLPELNELKYEIDKQGLEVIKSKNHNLINIIENIDVIIIEVKRWEAPMKTL